MTTHAPSRERAASAPIERGRVVALVLHYERPVGALACVRSLLRSTHPSYEIAVIDNGSSDAAVAALEPELAGHVGVQLVRVSPNRGYTGGVNAAFAHALATRAEYAWLLADDTRVDAGAMTALVQALRAEPGAGIAAALTLYANIAERIWFAGGLVGNDRLGRATHRGLNEPDRGRFEAGPVDFANGSSLFVRREVLEKIGGLDEAYFTYWEDADFCARAAEEGFGTWFVPGARVWHDVTPDTESRLDRARLYDARNRMIWHARHRRARLPLVLLSTLAAVPWLAASGRSHEGWLQLKGVLAFLSGSRGRMDA
jgi:GT2 family glycosyltransferase